MDKEAKTEKYILDHIDQEDALLQQLDRETHLKIYGARMISGHIQGQALYLFSRMIQPDRILEIGTFTGYSAICLAKGLKEGGKLITIEVDDELEPLAREYVEKSGLKESIIQITGPALEVIPTLDETFDLVFLDADKREYSSCYQLFFDQVRPGGFILADNTLWSGKVLDSAGSCDEQTRGIMAFNEMIRDDSRVEKVILPFRDGMTIIRKK
ncbi:MAG: O-methyltransferase [Mariniphaga sp.]|nr:O-methyltransferase [Mariniphaga sp.]MDD4225207.1 O-methyltransferase [Mariniphaga sp.]MDD4424548.1 O-methyltransferase [Mariniphaga sp.]